MIRLWALGLVLCCSVSATAGDDVFSVATLNVDGLPSKIWIIPSNPDGPGSDGTRTVSQYLAQKGYDIIATQEDFDYDEELRTDLDEDYDCGLWQGGIDLGQVNWLKIWDTKFETDGLRLFWRRQHQLENETAVAWTDAYGRFDHCWDDMVTKGFGRCEMTLADGHRIVVYNKADLARKTDQVSISALQGDISELTGRIEEMFKKEKIALQQPSLNNERQISLMRQARGSIAQAQKQLVDGVPLDLVNEDIEAAYRCLKEILGQYAREDLLDGIFSRFGVGK